MLQLVVVIHFIFHHLKLLIDFMQRIRLVHELVDGVHLSADSMNRLIKPVLHELTSLSYKGRDNFADLSSCLHRVRHEHSLDRSHVDLHHPQVCDLGEENEEALVLVIEALDQRSQHFNRVL